MGTANEAHDRLVNDLFGSGLTLAAVLDLPRLDCEVANRVRDVIAQLDVAIREVRDLAFAAVIDEHERLPFPAVSTRCVEPQPRLVSSEGERCSSLPRRSR